MKFIERLSEGHKNICIDMKSRLRINWQPNFTHFEYSDPFLAAFIVTIHRSSCSLVPAYWHWMELFKNNFQGTKTEEFLFSQLQSLYVVLFKNDVKNVIWKKMFNRPLCFMLMQTNMNILWLSLVQTGSDIKILRYWLKIFYRWKIIGGGTFYQLVHF